MGQERFEHLLLVGGEQVARHTLHQAIDTDGKARDVARQLPMAHRRAPVEYVHVARGRHRAGLPFDELEAGAKVGEARGLVMRRGLVG